MNLRNNIFLKIMYVLFSGLFLTSCECSRDASGVIMDETTQQPLDSVKVEGLTITLYSVFSDSLGNYSIGTSMTGAVGGCPDYKVSFSKEGYYSQVLVNPDGNVYMRKE